MHQKSFNILEGLFWILLIILVVVGIKYPQQLSNFNKTVSSITSLWKVYLAIAFLILPFLIFLIWMIRKIILEKRAKNMCKIFRDVEKEKIEDEIVDKNDLVSEQNKTNETEEKSKVKQTLNNKEQNKSIKNVAEKALPKRHFKIVHDFDKGFFNMKNLSPEDIKKLGYRNYKQVRMLNIYGKVENYLIKPRLSESEGHLFLVMDIAEYIKKFTDKVEIYETVRPDIIFTANNKKYAIEVETGKVLERDKNKFLKKIENLNFNFKNRWFFVVTDRNIASKYKKFGKTYDKRNIKKMIDGIFKGR